jgi:hypothetical protein
VLGQGEDGLGVGAEREGDAAALRGEEGRVLRGGGDGLGPAGLAVAGRERRPEAARRGGASLEGVIEGHPDAAEGPTLEGEIAGAEGYPVALGEAVVGRERGGQRSRRRDAGDGVR